MQGVAQDQQYRYDQRSEYQDEDLHDREEYYNEDEGENQYEGQNEDEDEDNDEGKQRNLGILYFWSGDFHPESLERVYHYPLVQYTSNYLLDYYNDMKNSSRLLRFVLERFVERNIKFVAFTPFTKIVLSIATRVGKPILIRLDNFACNQLDALEDSELALLPYYLVDKSLDITEGTLDFWLPARGKYALEFESENEGRLDLEDFSKLDQEGSELDAVFARLRYLRSRAEGLASNMKMRMRDRLGVVPYALPVSDFIGARLIGVIQLAHNIMNTPRDLLMLFDRVRNNVLDHALSIGKQTLVLMWMVASPVLHLAHESGVTLRDSVYNTGNKVSGIFDWASTHMLPENLRLAARRLMLLFKNFVTTGRLNWRKVKKTIREAPLATDMIEDKKGKSRKFYGDQQQEEEYYGGENEFAMEEKKPQGGRRQPPLKLFEPRSEPAQETPQEEGEGEMKQGGFEGQPQQQQGFFKEDISSKQKGGPSKQESMSEQHLMSAEQGFFKEDISSKQKGGPSKEESMSEQHLMSAGGAAQEPMTGVSDQGQMKKGDLSSAPQQSQPSFEGKKEDFSAKKEESAGGKQDLGKDQSFGKEQQKKDVSSSVSQQVQQPAQEKSKDQSFGKEQQKKDVSSSVSQQAQPSFEGGKQDISKGKKEEDFSSKKESAGVKQEISKGKKEEDFSLKKESAGGKQDLSKDLPLGKEQKQKEDFSASASEVTPLLQDIHPQGLSAKMESYAPEQSKKDQLDRMEPKPHLGQEKKEEKKEEVSKSQEEPSKSYSEALSTQSAPTPSATTEEKPSYAAVATGEASPSDIRKATEQQQQQPQQEPSGSKSWAAVAKAEPVQQPPSYAAVLASASQPSDDSSKARGEKKDLDSSSLSKSAAFGEEDKSLSKEQPTSPESGESYHEGNVREKMKMFEGLSKGDKSAVFGK